MLKMQRRRFVSELYTVTGNRVNVNNLFSMNTIFENYYTAAGAVHYLFKSYGCNTIV